MATTNPNIFTPGPTCYDNIYTLYPDGGDTMIYNTYASSVNEELVAGYKSLDTSCFPDGFGYTSSATAPDGSLTALGPQSPLSPATCPFAYTNAAQIFSTDASGTVVTVATCCPSSMSLRLGAAFTAAPFLKSWACQGYSSITYLNDSMLPASIFTSHTVWARQITVSWEQKDYAALGITTATATAGASSTLAAATTTTATTTSAGSISTPTSTVQSNSSGLSAGAIAGIVVGVIAGIAILLILGLIWRRRRESRPTTTNEKAELPSEGAEYSQLDSTGFHELQSQSKPGVQSDRQVHELHSHSNLGEADSGVVRAELGDGRQRAEAPAHVEVDLSRPAR